MLKKLRKNKKGFTLAELLIVVAIIGVLVAISIPIFTAQLEKAREATDMANIRSAMSTLQAAYLGNDTTAPSDDTNITYEYTAASGSTAASYKATVNATQTQDNWQSTNGSATTNIGGKNVKAVTKGSSWTITVGTDGNMSIS